MTRHPDLDARLAVALAAAAIACAATAFAPQVLNDGDTFLHIAAGRRMLADHAVLFADPFSFTAGGTAWDAHEWLAEIAMALSFGAGGWSGLVAMFAAAAACAAGVLSWSLGRWLPPAAQAVASLLAMACMSASLLARPHLLALPLLVLWTAELVRARSANRAPPLWLAPLMTLWINIHGSFLLGLALAGALALEALIDAPGNRMRVLRDWSLFGVLSAAACFVNPHGIDGLLFPLTLMATPSLAHVGEWQPVSLSLFQPAFAALAISAYVLATRRVTLSALRWLLIAGLIYMALAHMRHQMVAAAIVPLLIAEPLGRALGKTAFAPRFARTGIAAALFLLCALLAGRLLLPLARSDGPVSPMTALRDVPAALRNAPVLNDYSFGGYLIFAGVRPFIDSRVELYGERALRHYAALIAPDPAALAETLRRYRIRWTILRPASPLVAEFDALPGWHRLYTGSYAVVHIRDSAAP